VAEELDVIFFIFVMICTICELDTFRKKEKEKKSGIYDDQCVWLNGPPLGFV
jgi:hypothetical protein